MQYFDLNNVNLFRSKVLKAVKSYNKHFRVWQQLNNSIFYWCRQISVVYVRGQKLQMLMLMLFQEVIAEKGKKKKKSTL